MGDHESEPTSGTSGESIPAVSYAGLQEVLDTTAKLELARLVAANSGYCGQAAADWLYRKVVVVDTLDTILPRPDGSSWNQELQARLADQRPEMT
jgi:hypothetical protein